jgi:hypothetical protein
MMSLLGLREVILDAMINSTGIPISKIDEELEQLICSGIDYEVDSSSKFILLMSPCRSGSTALLRAISAVGLISYYQPMKSILKWHSVGGRWIWKIPNSERICLKETWGPCFKWQIRYNPIKVLTKLGVAKNHIRIIFLIRNTSACLQSWLRNYLGKIPDSGILHQHFEDSYVWQDEVFKYTIDHAIPFRLYQYENLSERESLEELKCYLDLGGDDKNFGVFSKDHNPYMPPSPDWFIKEGEMDRAYSTTKMEGPPTYNTKYTQNAETIEKCERIYTQMIQNYL